MNRYLIYRINESPSDRFVEDKMPVAIVLAKSPTHALYLFDYFFKDHVEYYSELHDHRSKFVAIHENKASSSDWKQLAELSSYCYN